MCKLPTSTMIITLPSNLKGTLAFVFSEQKLCHTGYSKVLVTTVNSKIFAFLILFKHVLESLRNGLNYQHHSYFQCSCFVFFCFSLSGFLWQVLCIPGWLLTHDHVPQLPGNSCGYRCATITPGPEYFWVYLDIYVSFRTSTSQLIIKLVGSVINIYSMINSIS